MTRSFVRPPPSADSASGAHPLPGTYEVPATARGLRLDAFLVKLAAREGPTDSQKTGEPPFAALAGLSRGSLQRLLERHAILLNHAPAKPSVKLQGGEVLTMVSGEAGTATAQALMPEPMRLDIVYEDAHIVVVNKPAGLVVHPGAGHPAGTLVHGLLAHCGELSTVGAPERPGIVHRLDRGTSGLMVVAKTDAAHAGLVAQFAIPGRVHKVYLAFTHGTPSPLADTIISRYGRHPGSRVRFSSKVAAGKQAITHYSVEAQAHGLSRIRVRLGTGRTHQIRVHLADRGHPIVGDPLYGAGRKGPWRPDSVVGQLVGSLCRQALHAMELGFVHPVTTETHQFQATLPSDISALNALLERTL